VGSAHIDSDHAKVSLEVRRPKDILGFRPAMLYVRAADNGTQGQPQEYQWDDDLNLALVLRKVRAVSKENEKLRFALVLRRQLQRPEGRFGDGFFNSVLVKFVRESPFFDFPEVCDVLKDVFANQPDIGGRSLEDCVAAIRQVLKEALHQLMDDLAYSRPDAEEVLAGALARYLDERFTVTDRRRLGWT
jgi:hypothetical protein